MTALFILLIIGTTIWVGFDAKSRGRKDWLTWTLGTLLLWIVIFPVYLVKRRAASTP